MVALRQAIIADIKDPRYVEIINAYSVKTRVFLNRGYRQEDRLTSSARILPW